MRPLLAVRPVLRRDRRRPVHPARRSRRGHADPHVQRRAIRQLLLRQHDPDLSRRRADVEAVPVRVATWDLETTPSVCSYCSVGCPITNEARARKDGALPGNAQRETSTTTGSATRAGSATTTSPPRTGLTTPLVRDDDDEFQPVLGARHSSSRPKDLKDKKVGVIAGGHLTTEDAFAIAPRRGRC